MEMKWHVLPNSVISKGSEDGWRKKYNDVVVEREPEVE